LHLQSSSKFKSSDFNKNIFGIVFPLFFVLVATRSIEQIRWISYSAPVFYLYFLVTGFREIKHKDLKTSLLLIGAFGLWAMISTLWSPYPRDSFSRSIVFIISSSGIMIAGFSWTKYFNKKDLDFLLPLNLLLIIVSVFSLTTKIPYDYWAGYGFGLKSFWAHQNTLASLIIFTIPGLLFLPFKDKKFRLFVFSILFALNVYILILTHSRSSLIILLLSVFLFTILTKRFKLFGILILIFTLLTAVYFINKDFRVIFYNYLFKTESSLLERKKSTILPSYRAAEHGGWKGLGFGVSDTTVLENLHLNLTYHYEGTRLVREKTVSIFALIEETGWVGLALFLLFVFHLLYLAFISYLKTKDWFPALMICVLLGMCLHAQLEGWWLGIGSVQFPLFLAMAGITVGRFGQIPDKIG
jgi:cell division protein FtsW (lipid II flippase)